jgi:hypothetical protein
VAGSFQGWNAAGTPLTENATTGLYESTLEMTVGSAIAYKFLGGSDWGSDESVPAACGVDNGSGGYNRSFTLGADLASPSPVCFGSCNPCLENPELAGCMDPAAANYDATAEIDDDSCLYSVTLSVDASNLAAVDTAGLHVAGDFQGWNPAGTQLGAGADGVWSTEVLLSSGQTIAYKFLNGDAWGQDETVPTECGEGSDVLNRVFTLPADFSSPPTPCFASCGPCESAPPDGDGSGYCGPGTYWDATVSLCLPEPTDPVCVEDVNGDGTIGVSDLLQLLAVFGDNCP